MEEASDAFARLDEVVAKSAAGLPSLLLLRSAQAIVASSAGLPDTAAHGADAFAALLGWWYAAESREFVLADRALRRCALALDATAAKIRGGRTLTLAMISESVDGTGDADGTDGRDDPDDAETAGTNAVEAILWRADDEAWPSLLLAAELHAAECAPAKSLPVAIARAVAPLVGGLRADVHVIAPTADDVPRALHGLAAEARAVRRRVNGFREQCVDAVERAREFGRGTGSALALLDLLAATPAITVLGAVGALGLTAPTVGAAVERLVGAGLLREITGRGRDRVFVYEPAIALAG